MNQTKNCFFCDSVSRYLVDHHPDRVFYTCPICGRYQLTVDAFHSLDRNKTPIYLAHNKFSSSTYSPDYRYHTTLPKEECDNYRAEFESGNNTHGRPVHMDAEIIDNWYPKSFSERIDYILLYIHNHAPHIGQKLFFTREQIFSVLFIDRMDVDHALGSSTYGKTTQRRDISACYDEANYMLKSLEDAGLVEYSPISLIEENIFIRLTPQGYARVDSLLKNTTNGRNVLVAMKFGEDTIPLREAIRSGITKAGYVAEFIDEVPHNGFITPELLKHIRDSKFVVVDLTHQNNGAYFEEGYAMGLGKPVIQLCKAGTQLHFDIAQKNTIMWKSEDDIADRLYNRIKATIE